MQPVLDRDGFELIFAVSDLQAARQILGADARIVQAPVWPDLVHRGARIVVTSHSDILSLAGFADLDTLAAVVDAWRELFELVGPAVAIIDHGPAAQLAARIAGLQSIVVGSGFTMPPLGYPTFPPLRADLVPSIPEAKQLAVAQEVLQARGVTDLPQTLPDLFRSDMRLPVGLPELDPYRSFRREPFYAPASGFAAPTPPASRKLFVYLGRELPYLAARLQVIGELDVPAIIYLRGGDAALAEFLRMRGKTVLQHPGDIGAILGSVSHVLSQGGAMLASEVLAAGRPHFMLSTHFETTLNASLLTNAGYGRTMDAESDDIGTFRRELHRFVHDQDLAARTLAYAKLLAQRPLPNLAEALRDGVRALAGQLAA